MSEFPRPGVIYECSEPEFIGCIPVHQELEILPALARNEWEGKDAIPLIAGDLSGMPCRFKSNIAKGSTVMFRGEWGGWYMVNVEKRLNPFAKDRFFVVITIDGRNKQLPIRFTDEGWVVDISGVKR